MEPLKSRVAASKRFSRTSKMKDTDVYAYASSEAQKRGGTVRAGKAKGNPERQKQLLSSLSRRSTESSRRRALQRILGGYGQKLRP